MANDKPSVPQPAKEFTADGELVIPYRPYASLERWVKYRFSAFSSAKAWFTLGLVVLFFGLGGPQLIVTKIGEFLAPGTSTGTMLSGLGSTSSTTHTDDFVLPGTIPGFLCGARVRAGSIFIASDTCILQQSGCLLGMASLELLERIDAALVQS